jgi:hypothetical protein
MQKQHESYARWYDQHETIRIILKVVGHFPSLHRKHIGQKFHQIATQHSSMLMERGMHFPLETDDVLRLYKSKRKKRWYDAVYPFHSALNMLMPLPDGQKNLVSEKCEPLKEEVFWVAEKLGLDLTAILSVHEVAMIREARRKQALKKSFVYEGNLIHQSL